MFSQHIFVLYLEGLTNSRYHIVTIPVTVKHVTSPALGIIIQSVGKGIF